MLDTNIFEEILKVEADYALLKSLTQSGAVVLYITSIQIAELCRTGDFTPQKYETLDSEQQAAYLARINAERSRRERLLIACFELCKLVEVASENGNQDEQIAAATLAHDIDYLVTQDIRMTNQAQQILNYADFISKIRLL